jgi:hypothetical protein
MEWSSPVFAYGRKKHRVCTCTAAELASASRILIVRGGRRLTAMNRRGTDAHTAAHHPL